MIKESQIGFIKTVGEITYVGNAQTPKQIVVLHIPGYDYQDRTIPPEDWEMTLLGAAVDRHNIHQRSVGEKAKVTMVITSKEWHNTETGKTFYNVNCLLREIQWLGSTLSGIESIAHVAAPSGNNDQPA